MAQKKPSVTAVVWDIAGRVGEQMNIKIWDVRYLKEGSDWHLHVLIDKDGGISIEECEKFYRAFDPLLDEADPIDHPYQLEIESPGIERSLTRPEHYDDCKGRTVCVTLIRPDESGQKIHTGELLGLEDGEIAISVGDETIRFDKKSVSSVKTVFDESDFD
ncbi:MAG: ribosome maturation factor RimP [Clostridia bacterium]|nr:ribosome maturation factor RimP [Clostridia bacterium]